MIECGELGTGKASGVGIDGSQVKVGTGGIFDCKCHMSQSELCESIWRKLVGDTDPCYCQGRIAACGVV